VGRGRFGRWPTIRARRIERQRKKLISMFSMLPKLFLGFAAGLMLAAFVPPAQAAAPDAADGTVSKAEPEAHSTSTAAQEDAVAASDSWSMLFVFALSTFIGLGVIGRVSRLLHTPLMSLTNAISAIAIVGSILVAGSDYPTPIRMLGAIGVFASMTNIVSGFLITDRMLKMFRQTRPVAAAVESGNGAPAGSPSAGPASH
jgi:NAD(P) transhydrogenase subunit alpha